MIKPRQEREAAGRRAEALAAVWLRLKGYRILARRFRGPGGEIDLIAARPPIGKVQLVAFVEVKQRGKEAALAEAISPQQRRRIEAAAHAFLGANHHLAGAACRFDAVYILPGKLPTHVPNLWQSGS